MAKSRVRSEHLRQLVAVAGVLVAVVVAGALLAPPLFLVGEALVQGGHAELLRGVGFARYLHRSVLLAGLLALCLGKKSRGPQRRVGLRGGAARLLRGFALGSAGVAAMALGLVAVGRLGAPHWPAADGAALLRLGAIAWAVAAVEEVLFRGALHAALRRALGHRAALALGSLLFALLHFVRADPHILPAAAVDYASGLRLLPSLCAPLARLGDVVGTLVTLVAMGGVLGDLVERSGSLLGGIGLHAGWVFALLALPQFCAAGPACIWAGGDLRDGLAAWLLMALSSCLGRRLMG